MDIKRSLSMPFRDPNWLRKMGLGGLWLLLWVTGPAALGAILDYIHSVAQGNETLPEWSGFGAKWIAGFLVQVAIAIYCIPVYLLYGIALSAFGSGGDGIAWLALSLAAIWLIAVAVFAYGAIVNFAVKGYFGNLFAVGEISRAIRSRSGYIGVLGMAFAIASILGAIIGIIAMLGAIIGSISPSLGLVLTFMGWILLPWLIFTSWMIMGHMLGQYAAKAYGLPGLVVVPSTVPVSVGYLPPSPPPPPPVQPQAAPPPASSVQPPAPSRATPPDAPQTAPPLPPKAAQPRDYPDWEEVRQDLAQLPEGLLGQLAKAMVFIVREDGRERAAVIVRIDPSELHAEVTPSTPMRMHLDFYEGSIGDVFGVYPLVLDGDRPAFKETWLHPYDDAPEVQSTDPLAAGSRRRLRLLLRQQYAWTIFVNWKDEILWVRKVEFTAEQVQSFRKYDATLDHYVGKQLGKMHYFTLLQEYLDAVTTEDLNAKFRRLFGQPAPGGLVAPTSTAAGPPAAFCSVCGTPNLEHTSFCTSCGQPLVHPTKPAS